MVKKGQYKEIDREDRIDPIESKRKTIWRNWPMKRLIKRERERERVSEYVDHIEGKRKKIWGNGPMKREWERVDYVERK